MGIRLENIKIDIKGETILDNVNLDVRTGEYVSLLGVSGAGKSTTIKVIAGILRQTNGHVFIDGRNVDDVPTHKRKASIVFQDIRLFPHMSVGENVAYALKIQGMKKEERRERTDYFLGLVRLDGFASRKVGELSGGQQQRVALARSVAGSPKALLLDEPFSGLDEELRDDMRITVKSLHDNLGLTTVMITHDAGEALMMSDRIAYMSRGRIVQYSTPTELYSNPATPDIAACFGDCISLTGQAKGGIFAVPGVSIPVDCHDGPATAVIRRKGVLLEKADRGAEVLDGSFRGDQYYLTVDIGGKECGLLSKELFVPGDHFTLEIDTGSVFVYSLASKPDLGNSGVN
jgi:putative spermidine/putrescine transport system ATP-binding protein